VPIYIWLKVSHQEYGETTVISLPHEPQTPRLAPR
jgi:hypothetical protein